MNDMIVFTKHALEKFAILKRHGVGVTEDEVRLALAKPTVVDHSRHPLVIAQVSFDARRVLRVVYKQVGPVKRVLRFTQEERNSMKKTKKPQPKVSYEPEADVLTWELSKKNIYSASEMGNVVIHFSKNNLPVLIEFLEASKFLSKANRTVRDELSPVAHKSLAMA